MGHETMQIHGNVEGFVECLSCGYFINIDPRVMNWVRISNLIGVETCVSFL